MTKRAKMANAFVAFVLALAVLLLGGGVAFAESEEGQESTGEAASANASSTAVSDDFTIWDWAGLVQDSTQYIGRIWTDKTVQTGDMTQDDITVKKAEGSDFLTALTALSSTSNLSSTSTTPLDIVMVLDASGSMSDSMGSGDSTSRIKALQTAANSFIDTIAVQNAGLDESKQHQVSLIKFAGNKTTDIGNDTYREGGYTYNYSQVMMSLSACTNDTKANFKNQINAINPAGATNAQAGMELAQDQTSGRSDAKKIVVFFADGTPTTESEFDSPVASNAVTAAYSMKQDGTTVYSIGIFDGASPTADPTGSSVSNENKFMHAVSSNYKNATYTRGSGKRYNWNFGDRSKDDEGNASAFYKSATNASDLEKIFEDISKEITEGAGYPTETTEGEASTTGCIIFDDQLGDYMQVNELSTLVYNGQVYKDPEVTKVRVDKEDFEGYSYTYTFNGTVNSESLSNIIINVEQSDEIEDGDKVTVQIPAALIPLRHFKIDLTNNTMTVDEPTTPVSVFYSSGLKDGVEELLANPDSYMERYIAANTDENGKVKFYANEWSDTKQDKDLGTTKALFNPSKQNKYYYFTQNTPVYTDEACTQRATSVEADGTYYYKHDFYRNENGTPVADCEVCSFPGSSALDFTDAIGSDDDGAIINAGTPRLLYLNGLHKAKEDNVTGTATDVLSPKWEGGKSVADTTTVRSFLGNNGKLTLDKPATLEVKKTVKVPDSYDLNDYKDTDFTFNISVPDAAGKSLQAKVVNEDGTAAGEVFTLTFDGQGKATHSIKHGQTLQVFGLSAGWSYEVSEASLPGGFTQTDPVNDDGNPVAVAGTFEAGATATASFTNKYSATGTLDGATNLKVEKNLEGRDWIDGDEFTFKIEALTESAPMPESDTVTVTGSDASSFGDIAYTKPGTYKYQVTEDVPEAKIGGVDYSQAVYQVVVTATDNGDGTLKVESVKAQTKDDSGTEQTGELTPVETMVFTNTYTASYDYGANGGLQVSKTLTGRDMAKGEFAFTITGADDASKKLLTDADTEFSNDKTCAAGKADVMKKLANVKFTQADDGKEFTFTVAEKVPAEAQKLSGVTYDTTSHEVKITVADNHDGTLNVATTVDGKAGNTVAFTNKYTGPATYDTAAAGLTKVLKGRDWKEGESFTFSISAEDGVPMPQIDGREVSSVTVYKANSENFSFGTITFTPEMLGGESSKTFVYNVAEQKGGEGGITYDTHTATIEVTVTDNGEDKLTATAQVDGATFTNTYKAETKEPVSISANKVLDGRDLEDGEFSFGVKYAKDYAAAEGEDLFTATNDKDGKADFGAFNYGTEELTSLVKEGYASKDGNVWTINYVAYEKTDGLSEKGITSTVSSVPFTVKVTDKLDGTLTAKVDSPEKITFNNQYNTDEAKLSLDGLKLLKYDEGLTPDSIEGKYTFTLTSDDKNAPMPEKTEVKNGASGSVSFGEITFTLGDLNKALGNVSTDEDVDTASVNEDETANAEENTVDSKATKADESKSESGAEDADSDQSTENSDSSDADNNVETQNDNSIFDVASANADEVVPETGKVRSYTFIYKVTESGKVAGVTNDKEAAKKVYIKVTDDGKGHLTAQFVDEDGKAISEKSAFTFTNTYSVEPTKSSVTDSVEVTKKLTGRDLTEGEFTFELLDADDKVVATGSNDAKGKVSLNSIEYTKPGEYRYTLQEVDGGKTIDNVVYDSASYAVVVKVTDNGDGTLKAQSQIGESSDGLAFTNTYVEPEPEPTPDDDSDDTADDSSDDEESTDTEEAASESAKTGDDLLNLAVAVVVVAAASGAIAFAARRRQR
ncbi:MAG: FctA domain-containing protein [Coriobacteriia bacterium]|nr:FctA domain-containing protein [Coriobacteriia bacterium]